MPTTIVLARRGLLRSGLVALLARAGDELVEMGPGADGELPTWWDVDGPDVSQRRALARAHAGVCVLDHLDSLPVLPRLVAAMVTGTPLLAVVPDEAVELATRAFVTGATSVAALSCDPEQLSAAVTGMTCGVAAVPSGVARALVDGDAWTPAEQELGWLHQLASGATVSQVARKSGYADRSMYRRLRRVYRALGAQDKTGCLLAARRRGLI